MLSSFFSRTSILCFHLIPSFLFFLNHCSGKDFISTLPLPCYMLTNTHTHINCTMSALFLLSCQASQCLFYSSYSCCTPPTHSIHTTVNYLPLLILFSFLFPLSLLFLHSLWTPLLSSSSFQCPPLTHPSFSSNWGTNQLLSVVVCTTVPSWDHRDGWNNEG